MVDTNSRGIATRKRMVGPGRSLHVAIFKNLWSHDGYENESSVGDEHGCACPACAVDGWDPPGYQLQMSVRRDICYVQPERG